MKKSIFLLFTAIISFNLSAFDFTAAKPMAPADKMIFDAVKKDDTELLKNALAKSGNINAVNESLLGRSPLMQAAFLGRENIAKILIENGADVNFRSPVNGITALGLAAGEGHVGTAKVLLDAKADTEAVSNAGNTPAMEAAWTGRGAVIALLVSYGANLEARDKDNRSVLNINGTSGRGAATNEILAAKVDLESRDNFGRTALLNAAKFGNYALFATLLDAGADRNAVDPDGKNALIIAAENGDEICVVRLLELNFDKNFCDSSGKTALDYAKEKNRQSVIDLL